MEPLQTLPVSHHALLSEHCVALRASDATTRGLVPCKMKREPAVFVYVLQSASDAHEEATEEDETLVAFAQWPVPSGEFDGLWESLCFEGDIKAALLRYAETALLFSNAGVDATVVGCNRVVLLHGPPGTGKTSLCKGLAHKLAVRLSDQFAAGALVEINAHSLFSKWFSESGKLVTKLFSKITALVADKSLFVCVLIDEVESLAAARQSALNGSEPSDAIRVVNALLTQLDRLKRNANVLVLTTSNLSDAIDDAFIDRADLCRFVGHPGPEARYTVLASCVTELMRTGLVAPRERLFSYNAVCAMHNDDSSSLSDQLLRVARSCRDGISGRRLRKLPLLAFAEARSSLGASSTVDCAAFIVHLAAAAALTL